MNTWVIVTTVHALTSTKNLCVTVNFDLIWFRNFNSLDRERLHWKIRIALRPSKSFSLSWILVHVIFFGRHWLRVWRESKASLAWSHLFLQMLVRPCIKGFAIYSVNASSLSDLSLQQNAGKVSWGQYVTMKFLQLHTVLVAWPVQKDWFVTQLLCKSDLIVLGRSRTVRLVLMTFALFFCLFNRSVWLPHNCGKCGDCCCGSGLYRIFMSIIFLFLIHPQMYLDNFFEISLPLLYLLVW